jgi:peroxiredoxin
VPENDDKTDHLVGMKLADVELTSTQGKRLNIGQISGKLVIYCYPKTGKLAWPCQKDGIKYLAHEVVLYRAVRSEIAITN